IPPVRSRFLIALAAAGVLAVLTIYRPPAMSDAIDYRIDRPQTKSVAQTLLSVARPPGVSLPQLQRVIAVPLPGFKSWDRDSPREDGGSPSGAFDSVAATYLLRHGLDVRASIDVL